MGPSTFRTAAVILDGVATSPFRPLGIIGPLGDSLPSIPLLLPDLAEVGSNLNIFFPHSLTHSLTLCLSPSFSGQMFLMDRFFDGAFLTFGLEVIAFAEQDQEDRLDPLIYVFPRMTKCTFHKFGTSGEVEKHDALCLLPLNIVNEKVYIFLWFWFILLSVLSILVILYRIIIVISPKMRAYLLYIRFRLIRREVINTIVKKSYVGDWFLFYMLGKLSRLSFPH